MSPQFVGQPDLFAADRFHPSGAGYGRAMQVLVPAAIAELADLDPPDAGFVRPLSA